MSLRSHNICSSEFVFTFDEDEIRDIPMRPSLDSFDTFFDDEFANEKELQSSREKQTIMKIQEFNMMCTSGNANSSRSKTTGFNSMYSQKQFKSTGFLVPKNPFKEESLGNSKASRSTNGVLFLMIMFYYFQNSLFSTSRSIISAYSTQSSTCNSNVMHKNCDYTRSRRDPDFLVVSPAALPDSDIFPLSV